MGTSGSVSLFFINLIVFCFVFSGIYYVGFFRTAGVSYDINQPHVDYNLFTDSVYVRKLSFIEFFDNSIHDVTVTRSRIGTPEIVILYEKDGMSVKDTVIRRTLKREEYSYQSISYDVVLRNTVLTFLMQEPTDLFVVASTYNAAISEPDQSIEIDKQKSELFHWILIFQILVSWIFFGVFISLLYSKFRYES